MTDDWIDFCIAQEAARAPPKPRTDLPPGRLPMPAKPQPSNPFINAAFDAVPELREGWPENWRAVLRIGRNIIATRRAEAEGLAALPDPDQ